MAAHLHAHVQVWQVLPLVPPETMAWSPYSGLDALCGNVHLISLDSLVKDGLLQKNDLPQTVPIADVDFPKASAQPCLDLCIAAGLPAGQGALHPLYHSLLA